jgi:hypothetical protein
MMEPKQYSVEEIGALAAALGLTGEKAFVPPHGPNGLLTSVGVRPDMYSAVPRVGRMAATIPMYPSRNQNEIIEILTGVTAQGGTNPENTCSTAPYAGNFKVCQQVYPFGTFFKATQQVNIAEAGLYIDRADLDRRILNPPDMSAPFVPDVVRSDPTAINTHVGKALMEFGVGAQIDFANVDFRGSATNTGVAAHIGFIREYNGLESLIKTGHVDAITSVACPAVDSNVDNYNAALGTALVELLVNNYRENLTRAEQVGFPNASWAIIVHPWMKYDLVDVWSCNYNTARCVPTAENGRILNTESVTALRDEMLRGSYLLIDGERVPLMTDWGISYSISDATGVVTSDILIPALTDGTRALLYREYFPYTSPDMTAFQGVNMDEVRVMNGGFYLMGYSKVNPFCYTYTFTAKTRLILDAPFLSGRIDNVQWTPTVKGNNPDPAGSYHLNGGQTYRGTRL